MAPEAYFYLYFMIFSDEGTKYVETYIFRKGWGSKQALNARTPLSQDHTYIFLLPFLYIHTYIRVRTGMYSYTYIYVRFAKSRTVHLMSLKCQRLNYYDFLRRTKFMCIFD